MFLLLNHGLQTHVSNSVGEYSTFTPPQRPKLLRMLEFVRPYLALKWIMLLKRQIPHFHAYCEIENWQKVYSIESWDLRILWAILMLLILQEKVFLLLAFSMTNEPMKIEQPKWKWTSVFSRKKPRHRKSRSYLQLSPPTKSRNRAKVKSGVTPKNSNVDFFLEFFSNSWLWRARQQQDQLSTKFNKTNQKTASQPRRSAK